MAHLGHSCRFCPVPGSARPGLQRCLGSEGPSGATSPPHPRSSVLSCSPKAGRPWPRINSLISECPYQSPQREASQDPQQLRHPSPSEPLPTHLPPGEGPALLCSRAPSTHRRGTVGPSGALPAWPAPPALSWDMRMHLPQTCHARGPRRHQVSHSCCSCSAPGVGIWLSKATLCLILGCGGGVAKRFA